MAPELRNPFVGPRPIPTSAPIYGRDREIRELYNRLRARRIVLMHSPSGAGKSSLVNAGLAPAMEEAGYRLWRSIRVNLDPSGIPGVPAGVNRYLLSAMLSLEEEVPPATRRSAADLARLPTLRAYLDSRAPEDTTPVLVFDQFEEVITTDPRGRDAKQAFFEMLGQALDKGDYWALFVIREDYLGALAPYRDRIPTQLANTFRLDLLSREAATEACTRAAEDGGRSFPAVERLVADLAGVTVPDAEGAAQDLYVEPVQLQVVCQGLWDRMDPAKLAIEQVDLERFARVSEALGAYYADAVARAARTVEATERAIRDWVGGRLIQGGLRAQVRREAERSGGLDNELIAALVDSYLVRADSRAGALWYELSHDRMVAPVLDNNRRWAADHLNPMQVQAALWAAADRPDAQLLNARALPDALGWAEANPTLLNEVERDFLDRSRVLRRAEAARRRREIALSTVIGVIGVIAVLAAAYSRVLAQRSSEFQQLGEARNWRDRDPTVAAALLGGLDDLDDSSAARELAAELVPSPVASFLAERVATATWAPDGRVLLVRTDRTVSLEDPSGGRPAEEFPWPARLRLFESVNVPARAQLSPDGSLVAVAHLNRGVTRIRVEASRPDDRAPQAAFEELVTPPAGATALSSLQWSPDGRYLLVDWDTGGVAVLSVELPRVVQWLTRSQPLDRVDIPPGGAAVLTEDHRGRIWSWRGDRSTPVRAAAGEPAPTGRLEGAMLAHLLLDTRRSGPVVRDGSDGRLLTISPTGKPYEHRPGRGADGYEPALPLDVGFAVTAAWMDLGATLVAGAAGELELHPPDGPAVPCAAGADAVRVAAVFKDAQGFGAVSADDAGHVRICTPSGIRTAPRTAAVREIVTDPTGRYAALNLMTGGFVLLRIADGADAPLSHPVPVRSASFSPDGRWLSSHGNDDELRVWELDKVPVTVERSAGIGTLAEAIFGRDGRHLLARSLAGTIELRDTTRDSAVWRTLAPGAVRMMSLADEAPEALVLLTDGRLLHLAPAASGGLAPSETWLAPDPSQRAVGFVAAGGLETGAVWWRQVGAGTIHLGRGDAGDARIDVGGVDSSKLGVHVSPRDGLMAVTGSGRALTVWQRGEATPAGAGAVRLVATDPEAPPETHRGSTCACWTPDGRLAVTRPDGTGSVYRVDLQPRRSDEESASSRLQRLARFTVPILTPESRNFVWTDLADGRVLRASYLFRRFAGLRQATSLTCREDRLLVGGMDGIVARVPLPAATAADTTVVATRIAEASGAILAAEDGAPGWLVAHALPIQSAMVIADRGGTVDGLLRVEVFSDDDDPRPELLPPFVAARVVRGDGDNTARLVAVSAEGQLRTYPLPFDESAKLRLAHAPACLGVERRRVLLGESTAAATAAWRACLGARIDTHAPAHP